LLKGKQGENFFKGGIKKGTFQRKKQEGGFCKGGSYEQEMDKRIKKRMEEIFQKM